MCGIAGFFRKNEDSRDILERMLVTIRHRGPDASGIWRHEATGLNLGHVRLSIRDLSAAGAQPMLSASGQTAIVYNGELYCTQNYNNLLCEYSFRGTSDTELLLEALEALGTEKTLEFSRGMFAFAAFDLKERRLTLAVDRAGEKPLYYGFIGDSFVFGSEPSVFPHFPGFAPEVDADALGAFFRYSYVPSPASIYKGINKLRPGEMLTLSFPFGPENLGKKQYWSMMKAAKNGAAAPFAGSEEEALEELERLLRASVTGQLVSDVPLGAYLSGGIDSSLVTALMAEAAPVVRTYTMGFEQKEYDEAPEAAAIARHLGVENTCRTVTEAELLETVPKLSEIFAEPFGDSSEIPSYLVAQLASEREKVVLSGDAGDELFGGYTTYLRIAALGKKYLPMNGFIKGAGRAALGIAGIVGGKQRDKFYRIQKCLKAGTIEELHEAVCYHIYRLVDGLCVGENYDNSLFRDLSEYSKDLLTAQMLLDACHYLPGDVLVKVDRCGMAVSLENRIPFLDKDVLEFVWRLPSDLQFGSEGGKNLLKKLLYQRVPKELMDRPKKGFSVPLKKWLVGELKSWAEERIYESRLISAGLVRKENAHGLWEEFLRYGQGERAVWNLLMAEDWYSRWVVGGGRK